MALSRHFLFGPNFRNFRKKITSPNINRHFSALKRHFWIKQTIREEISIRLHMLLSEEYSANSPIPLSKWADEQNLILIHSRRKKSIESQKSPKKRLKRCTCPCNSVTVECHWIQRCHLISIEAHNFGYLFFCQKVALMTLLRIFSLLLKLAKNSCDVFSARTSPTPPEITRKSSKECNCGFCITVY